MLGSNPRRAGISTASILVPPSSSSEMPPKTAAAATAAIAQQSDGLMVKAIDEIFRHVETNDEPDSFKVNDHFAIIQIMFFRRQTLLLTAK